MLARQAFYVLSSPSRGFFPVHLPLTSPWLQHRGSLSLSLFCPQGEFPLSSAFASTVLLLGLSPPNPQSPPLSSFSSRIERQLLRWFHSDVTESNPILSLIIPRPSERSVGSVFSWHLPLATVISPKQLAFHLFVSQH